MPTPYLSAIKERGGGIYIYYLRDYKNALGVKPEG